MALVVDVLGRVPDVGETVEVEGFSVTVVAVDEARVEGLRIAAPPLEDRDAA